MNQPNHHHDVLNDLNPQHRALRQMIPEVYRGFGEMSGAALTSGTLDRRIKELIAMVIGVAHGCDGCIASHARGAVRAGASKEEAAEAIGVGIMMCGGPATIYGARAYDAFCEFAAADRTARVDHRPDLAEGSLKSGEFGENRVQHLGHRGGDRR